VYADARPCLEALRAGGYLVGIGGNQPAEHASSLRELDLPADVVRTSGEMGVEKPSLEFFVRLTAEAGLRPKEAAYVGDRVDNDVLPAKAAGMVAVFLRRGPWAAVHATWPEAADADLTIDSLDELAAGLQRLRSARAT
jgi:FMN phosphatase YigB (HAD superfamily)